MDGYGAIASLAINGLMGIVMYFMKMAHDNTKDNIKRLESEIEKVRETSFRKEDFKEFKEDLWKRLDKFEESVEKKLQK